MKKEEHYLLQNLIPYVGSHRQLTPDQTPGKALLTSPQLRSSSSHIQTGKINLPSKNYYIRPPGGTICNRNDFQIPSEWKKNSLLYNLMVGEFAEIRYFQHANNFKEHNDGMYSDIFMGLMPFFIVPDGTYAAAFFRIYEATKSSLIPRIIGYKVPIIETSEAILLGNILYLPGLTLLDSQGTPQPLMDAISDNWDLIANIHLICQQNGIVSHLLPVAESLQKHCLLVTNPSDPSGPKIYIPGNHHLYLTDATVGYTGVGTSYFVKRLIGHNRMFTITYDTFKDYWADPHVYDMYMPTTIIGGAIYTKHPLTGDLHLGRVMRIGPFLLAYNLANDPYNHWPGLRAYLATIPAFVGGTATGPAYDEKNLP
ncbi:MAG: hypothetical protein ACTSRK_21295 [Promethearchaeota archaeon]